MINTTYDDYYAFTYKKNVPVSFKPMVTREMYDEVLRHIVDCGMILHSVYYELDSLREYHIHGIAYVPQQGLNPTYYELKLKGYTSKWTKIYDFCGWDAYIQKDQCSQKENDNSEA